LLVGDYTDPWEHVIAIGLGSAFGNAVANWEVKLQEDLDKKLQEVSSANKKRFIGTYDLRFVPSAFHICSFGVLLTFNCVLGRLLCVVVLHVVRICQLLC
jgi:hypothetical protein